MDLSERFRGCLLGLAAGDAVGTTVEFKPRGTFAAVTDMTGGGPFRLAPGQWTDDTSMALCLASSLVELRRFDARDQMIRYCRWQSDGYMSSTGACFDIGTTTARALARFRDTGDPFAGSTDPESAGNGCIMRLAPVAMFFFPDEAEAIEHASRQFANDARRRRMCRGLGTVRVDTGARTRRTAEDGRANRLPEHPTALQKYRRDCRRCVSVQIGGTDPRVGLCRGLSRGRTLGIRALGELP